MSAITFLSNVISTQTCKRMLALRDKCLHPTTQKPYVKSSVGGRDNSPEGHQVVATPFLSICV